MTAPAGAARLRQPFPAGGDRSGGRGRCPHVGAPFASISLPSAWATQPATARMVLWPAAARSVLNDAQAAELGEYLFPWRVAYVAGVEDDHVGLGRRGGRRVAPAGRARRPLRALSYTFIWQPQVMTCRRLGFGSRVSDRLMGTGSWRFRPGNGETGSNGRAGGAASTESSRGRWAGRDRRPSDSGEDTPRLAPHGTGDAESPRQYKLDDNRVDQAKAGGRSTVRPTFLPRWCRAAWPGGSA